MCQRRQKSEKPIDTYGSLKLVGNENPKHKATPVAVVEYPAKSKNIFPENAKVPSHASKNDTAPLLLKQLQRQLLIVHQQSQLSEIDLK
jgi:hypothetical protein